eukprot:6491984-Amphidinium_carterae.3
MTTQCPVWKLELGEALAELEQVTYSVLQGGLKLIAADPLKRSSEMTLARAAVTTLGPFSADFNALLTKITKLHSYYAQEVADSKIVSAVAAFEKNLSAEAGHELLKVLNGVSPSKACVEQLLKPLERLPSKVAKYVCKVEPFITETSEEVQRGLEVTDIVLKCGIAFHMFQDGETHDLLNHAKACLSTTSWLLMLEVLSPQTSQNPSGQTSLQARRGKFFSRLCSFNIVKFAVGVGGFGCVFSRSILDSVSEESNTDDSLFALSHALAGLKAHAAPKLEIGKALNVAYKARIARAEERAVLYLSGALAWSRGIQCGLRGTRGPFVRPYWRLCVLSPSKKGEAERSSHEFKCVKPSTCVALANVSVLCILVCCCGPRQAVREGMGA